MVGLFSGPSNFSVFVTFSENVHELTCKPAPATGILVPQTTPPPRGFGPSPVCLTCFQSCRKMQVSSCCLGRDVCFYGLQGRRGAGNPGRGFANWPMGLRLECNSKDYLIGCGLGFRIKVWHLPKPGPGVFWRGRGPSLCSPGSSHTVQHRPGSLSSVEYQETWPVPASLHPQIVLLLDDY